MNPTQTSNPNVVSPENLLEKAFENSSFTQVAPVDEENLVTHTEDHKAEIRNSWAEFYALKSEVIEGPVSKVEVSGMVVEQQFTPHVIETTEKEISVTATSVIENQKGSGSSWAESGIKIIPDYKDVGKSLFGAFNIFREIFMDTSSLFIKAFTEKVITPEEAKKNAEKKAEQKKKNNRIQAFYDKMAAQAASVVTVEAVRMESQEKENINKTLKLTSTSYKGIKDSFGRLTVYAASMFEREQMDQEKQAKKVEKEQKMSAVGKGPDLNMDKVAEGGFLSSTGGQGAG